MGEESRWIPWAIVGFFVVVIAVNVVMMTLAFSTWPGLSTRNHYLEGLAFNEQLEARRRQDALGWQVDLAARVEEGRRVDLALDLVDAAGGADAVMRVPHVDDDDRRLRRGPMLAFPHDAKLIGHAVYFHAALRLDVQHTRVVGLQHAAYCQ